MTNLEAVSIITNTLKLNNRDDKLSRRYILNVLRNTATTLISQKLLDRTLSSELSLYTQIPCFQFEKIDVKKCSNIEFRYCKTLMKSVCPLPKLVFSRIGASIKEINSLDGNYRFVFLDKGQYQRNKSRKYSIKDEVYIYLDSDNHLYIPDNEIQTVDLTILTVSPEDIKECSNCGEKKDCGSNWNLEFKIPHKLQDTLFQQTLQLLGMTRQIREDSNPNSQQNA